MWVYSALEAHKDQLLKAYFQRITISYAADFSESHKHCRLKLTCNYQQYIQLKLTLSTLYETFIQGGIKYLPQNSHKRASQVSGHCLILSLFITICLNLSGNISCINHLLARYTKC